MSNQEMTAADQSGRELKPIDSVRVTLDKLKPQLEAALPRHLTVDRLVRVAMTAVQNTPKLLECDRQSLWSAIMSCATLGLEPDGILGQAYLIPFAGKVQFIPGYKGLISLARNSGDVTSIQAQAVYSNDEFEYEYGINEKLKHVPAQGDRGTVTHFWAMAKFKDGGHHWDVLTLAEVEKIRNNSSGYKSAVTMAKKYNKPLSTPWNDHFDEMAKKTVIRRIAKYLPLSVQKAAALADSYDTGRHAHINSAGDIVIEGTPVAEIEDQSNLPKSTKLDQFEEIENIKETAKSTVGQDFDQQTGEIIRNDPEKADAETATEQYEPDDGRLALDALLLDMEACKTVNTYTAFMADNEERIKEIFGNRPDLQKIWFSQVDIRNKQIAEAKKKKSS